jgi:hypothetical protein
MYVNNKNKENMINIFYSKPPIIPAIIKTSNWDYVRTILQCNISEVINYYRSNIRSVKSNHLLARLLDTISLDKDMDIDRYYLNIDELSYRLAVTFGFTSPISKGNLFTGVFYGANNPEYVLSVNDYFDIHYANEHWEDIEAVKVITHPKNDLLYMLPNGHMYNSEIDLTVVSINIPLLAIQYRAFYLNELNKKTDSVRGMNQFIGGYVIPNMLKSQSEIVILNRLYNKINDIPTNDLSNVKHPFALINNTYLLDKELDKVIYNIQKVSTDYNTIYSNIPSIYNENIYDTLLLPNMASTRQVYWLLLLSRLKAMDLLFTITGKKVLNKNQNIINELVQDLKSSSGISFMKEIIPFNVYELVECYFNKIFNIYNKEHLMNDKNTQLANEGFLGNMTNSVKYFFSFNSNIPNKAEKAANNYRLRGKLGDNIIDPDWGRIFANTRKSVISGEDVIDQLNNILKIMSSTDVDDILKDLTDILNETNLSLSKGTSFIKIKRGNETEFAELMVKSDKVMKQLECILEVDLSKVYDKVYEPLTEREVDKVLDIIHLVKPNGNDFVFGLKHIRKAEEAAMALGNSISLQNDRLFVDDGVVIASLQNSVTHSELYLAKGVYHRADTMMSKMYNIHEMLEFMLYCTIGYIKDSTY